jgi:hypothetical protein
MAKKANANPSVIDAARLAASNLEAIGARFALVGGLAVGARAEPRYTRDVDVAVSVADDREAERVVHAMSRRGYVVNVVIEQRRTGRMATVRLRHRAEPDVFIDLLFASCGIEPEVVAHAERVAYRPGVRLPVARAGHLIAMKLLSESEERLQDRIDLRALAGVAAEDDWVLAGEAVSLIRKRGFHRRRALLRKLRE